MGLISRTHVTKRYTEMPPETSTNPFPYGMPDVEKYGELLATPITLDRVREVTNLDEYRQQLIAEARYIADASNDLIKKEMMLKLR